MSDNRPARYVENGITYYRASSLGLCDKMFVALANDYQPLAHPEWFQEVLDEGTNAEAAINEMWEDQTELATIGSQDTLYLEVMDNVFVVGHTDGMTTTDEVVLREYKKFRPSTWEKFLRVGVESQPSYPWQVSVYMHAIGAEECEFVGGKYVDGKIEEVYCHRLLMPPIPLLAIKKRVAKLEGLINSGALVSNVGCQVQMYPCPMYYLHDDDEVVVLPRVDADDILKRLARELAKVEAALKPHQQEVKKLLEDAKILKQGVHGWLEANGIADGDKVSVEIDGTEMEMSWKQRTRAAHQVKEGKWVEVSVQTK